MEVSLARDRFEKSHDFSLLPGTVGTILLLESQRMVIGAAVRSGYVKETGSDQPVQEPWCAHADASAHQPVAIVLRLQENQTTSLA